VSFSTSFSKNLKLKKKEKEKEKNAFHFSDLIVIVEGKEPN
jgi:hypothetical protein